MKKLLSFLLALMMGLPLLIGTVSFPAAAAEGMVGQVSKQNELIKTAKALDKMPRTFDAVIKLPAAYKGRAGVILGNYMGGATTCISFEINDNGIPRLYYQDGSTVYNHLFTQVDIRSDGEPVRLTLVQDPTAKTVTCYLNGEAKQTVAASSLPDEILPTNPMVLGGD
ncbi:MAG: hypothetical protein IJC15_04470, partial [Clostridia bacterium]|nr:hypothetical protein [Clostridia bacterium]